jgi:hypothetical protein
LSLFPGSLWTGALTTFCGFAGGGRLARELYTDLEEISIAVKRPVILNGIDDVATRPDLRERVLQLELETIPKQKPNY